MLDSVKAEDFDTVFDPGGRGLMWDLAEDHNSIKLIETMLRAGKPVALACHAPGALRHAKRLMASRWFKVRRSPALPTPKKRRSA